LTDALFEVLERAAVDGLSPTPEVMNAIVRDVIARELDMAERARALRPALDHAAADALASGAEARIAQLRDALRRNDLQAAAGPVAAAAKRLGFAIDPNSDDGRILQRLVLRGLIQVAEENHRREQGEYRCDAELFLTRPTNGALAAAHAAAPTLDLVLAPRRLPGMPGPAAAPPQPRAWRPLPRQQRSSWRRCLPTASLAPARQARRPRLRSASRPPSMR